jgi:hypothetical protein
MFSELSRELLPIYLNDHFAGATVGLDLAKRAARQNEGTELGEFLDQLSAELDAHRNMLEDIMNRLDISRDPIKTGVGWLAEKLGRLKLNGRLLEYSPLSRVVELEGLLVGSQGRLMLWRTLAAAAPDEPRIADIDFVDLIQRTEENIEGLRQQHTNAVSEMLVAG